MLGGEFADLDDSLIDDGVPDSRSSRLGLRLPLPLRYV